MPFVLKKHIFVDIVKSRGCMFGKFSLVSLFTVLAIAPTIAFSASAVGKVRSALGTVDRQKAKQTDWSALRVGASIFQTDKVRTGMESEVIFGLPDGSTISIAENAEVEMSQLLEPNDEGGFETRFDIKKGHINFAVHKLQDKNSKFQFKTGTATASIRGTEGYIGGEGTFFAGLKTGKLEIIPDGKKEPVSIVAGETMIGKGDFVVLKLASSGNSRFAKKIEKLLAENKPVKDLVKDVEAADVSFQQELKAEAEAAAAAVSMNSFSISTPTTVEVCENGLQVDGYYKTSDDASSLVLSIGSGYKSSNLIRSGTEDGNVHNFSIQVPINDDNGLWTATKASFSFISGGVKSTKSIDLRVNKSCLAVNGKSPALSISSYDSLRCVANLSVTEMQNDAGIVSVSADGAQILEEALARNTQKRLALKPGIHEYVAKVEDLAGNKAEVSKSMGCFPSRKFKIDVVGPVKEKFPAPPAPPYVTDRNIYKPLHFQVRIPENDPSFLYKVLVKQNGKIILQETLTQIQNLDYQVMVALPPESVNQFDIEVTHKSGYKAKAKKIYEVSP